jgi:hypothetical protein
MINTLLDRLQKTRQTSANEWVACCPAHQDKSPSMGIKLTDDDKILIHCFAGCSVIDITSAIGMDLEDLFPPRQIDYDKKRTRTYFNPASILKCLMHESTVITLAASDIISKVPLSAQDINRVELAHQRFSDATTYCFK